MQLRNLPTESSSELEDTFGNNRVLARARNQNPIMIRSRSSSSKEIYAKSEDKDILKDLK